MKKLFALLLLGLFAFMSNADAQLLKTTRPAKDSVVNTDTTVISLGAATNDVVSIHLTGNRASGSVTGKVYLYVSIDASEYRLIDSVTLTNKAKVWAPFPLSRLHYSQYQLQYVSSGSVKVTGIRGHYLRRSN